VVDVVEHAVDRRLDGVDRERVQHQPEDAVAVGERPQLLVGEVPRRLVDGAAARVRDADRALVRLEALGEEPWRRVREIKDHAQFREPRQQRAAEP
jgi:hypothetical protein